MFFNVILTKDFFNVILTKSNNMSEKNFVKYVLDSSSFAKQKITCQNNAKQLLSYRQLFDNTSTLSCIYLYIFNSSVLQIPAKQYKGPFGSEVLQILSCSCCGVKAIDVEWKLVVFGKSVVAFKLQLLMVFGKF